MSLRKSQEGLLELEDPQKGPKCPACPEDEPMMSIDVRFKIYDVKKYSSAPTLARFAFNENSTVEEAAERVFQKAFNCAPTEIHLSIEKREGPVLNKTAIVDKEIKIKHLFQEDDILVLSDNYKGYIKKQNRQWYIKICVRAACIYLLFAVFIGEVARRLRNEHM